MELLQKQQLLLRSHNRVQIEFGCGRGTMRWFECVHHRHSPPQPSGGAAGGVQFSSCNTVLGDGSEVRGHQPTKIERVFRHKNEIKKGHHFALGLLVGINTHSDPRGTISTGPPGRFPKPSASYVTHGLAFGSSMYITGSLMNASIDLCYVALADTASSASASSDRPQPYAICVVHIHRRSLIL